MKLINDNKLHNGTFTATDESLNYPVDNLDHPFLAKRFQGSASSSTITVVLSSASTIDAIGHGQTNATSGTAILYTGGPTTYTSVESVTMDLTYDPCVSYTATSQASITKIDFELSTDDTYIYIGGVAAGEYYEIDNATADFDRGYQDNTAWTQTASGQSLANYQESLRSILLNFRPQTLTLANELVEVYRDIGIGSPFFIDIFPGVRDLMPPLYCCFSEAAEDTGVGNRRSITIPLLECK